MSADIGIYGLGVMGRNIALNIADHGFSLAVYNRTSRVTDAFVAQLPPGAAVTPCYDLAAFVGALDRPRRVFIMATAGAVVDRIIESLLLHLEEDDIIIDGGNSLFADTQRRWEALQPRGIRFLGVGISGGEEGARHGPAVMPGGDPQAWPFVQPILEKIAATAEDGQACCHWMGEGGAGHYVKMIHNGIEYGDMQLIAEAWQLLRDGVGLDDDAIAQTFGAWNQDVLSSYLIEITAEILRVREGDGSLRVDQILDAAGQKGTGRWTAIDALDLGVPVTLITEAVFARVLSSMKTERVSAGTRLHAHDLPGKGAADRAGLVDAIRDALYAAKIISYTQGFLQLREAASSHGWQLPFSEIAGVWRAGCIIRSRFLDDIRRAFDRQPDLPSLLFDGFFSDAVGRAEHGWREALILGIKHGIPLPALSAALSFYDGYRSANLPASLIQAQRDYFGAHTYSRKDRPAEQRWHTNWTGDLSEDAVDD